ncbi:abortive infection family protein [Photobacterium carnosum]|uniref:abortive infection family protein n=1 Tax=Photobacterium carnosum TaxID=2023717 RepID=UPI001E2A9A64|nr:abortive infection family protein [Photobacterium carnosum]MCD9500565.1 abortive phage infection protein [Photobacterium carnosum]
MLDLDNKQRLTVAKAAMSLTTGDWSELFCLTDCEDYPEEYRNFMNDVYYQNDGLKQSCINAIDTILNSNPENIEHIWEISSLSNKVKRLDSNLYDTIERYIDGEHQKNVSSPVLEHENENIYNALADAELLIEQRGPEFAYDRMHNAVHSFMREVCDNHAISYEDNHGITKLLKEINAHLKVIPADGRNDTVFGMLRSANSILDGTNYLRNHHSLAHPTETLLNSTDALFAINLAKSIISYVDGLLEK